MCSRTVKVWAQRKRNSRSVLQLAVLEVAGRVFAVGSCASGHVSPTHTPLSLWHIPVQCDVALSGHKWVRQQTQHAFPHEGAGRWQHPAAPAKVPCCWRRGHQGQAGQCPGGWEQPQLFCLLLFPSWQSVWDVAGIWMLCTYLQGAFVKSLDVFALASPSVYLYLLWERQAQWLACVCTALHPDYFRCYLRHICFWRKSTGDSKADSLW